MAIKKDLFRSCSDVLCLFLPPTSNDFKTSVGDLNNPNPVPFVIFIADQCNA